MDRMGKRGQAQTAVLLLIALVAIVGGVIAVIFLTQPKAGGPAQVAGTWTGTPEGGTWNYPSGTGPGASGTGGSGYNPWGTGSGGTGTGTTGGTGLSGSSGGTQTGAPQAPLTSNSWCVIGRTRESGGSTYVIQGMTTYKGQSLCKATVIFGCVQYNAYTDEAGYNDQSGGRFYIEDSEGNSITSSVDEPVLPAGAASGCADGSREALYASDIAGCEGTWTNSDLRATGAGSAESLCASGWHICGRSGDPREISSKVSAGQCFALGNGKFVAAVSHCASSSGCSYTTPYGCPSSGGCSEPICCGNTCSFGSCASGAWSRCTPIAPSVSCGNAPSSSLTGALCCKGGAATPAGTAPWCPAGQVISYEEMIGPGYSAEIIGMESFHGYNLCKGRLLGIYEQQTTYFYISQDRSVWYMVDWNGHVMQSYPEPLETPWIPDYPGEAIYR